MNIILSTINHYKYMYMYISMYIYSVGRPCYIVTNVITVVLSTNDYRYHYPNVEWIIISDRTSVTMIVH